MQPHLDRLSDQDVSELAEHYDDFAGDERLPASWRGWYANLADLLRVEAARRMIAAAQQRDPVAFCWFGRLAPPGVGGPTAWPEQASTPRPTCVSLPTL